MEDVSALKHRTLRSKNAPPQGEKLDPNIRANDIKKDEIEGSIRSEG
jgi:hypothetical protein